MIALLYCGNRAVFPGMLLSLLSVTEHCKAPLWVHILTMDLTDTDKRFTPVTEKQAAFLETTLQRVNGESRVTLHDCGALYRETLADSPNAATGYTPYTLLRLLIDRLPTLPERLLYLDTDTVALADITPLYTFDLAGREFAAARDFLGKFFIHPRYMNAGVMLFSLPALRESDLLTKARALCCRKSFPFPIRMCSIGWRGASGFCRAASTSSSASGTARSSAIFPRPFVFSPFSTPSMSSRGTSTASTRSITPRAMTRSMRVLRRRLPPLRRNPYDQKGCFG